MRETSYVHVYCTISELHPYMLNMTSSPAVVCVPFALMSESRHCSLSYTWHAQNTFRWIALLSTNFFVDFYFFSSTTTSPYAYLLIGAECTISPAHRCELATSPRRTWIWWSWCEYDSAKTTRRMYFLSVKTVSVILETWSLYVICHLQIIQYLGLH